MIRQMLLTALMSSAVASSVPLNSKSIDEFQYAYKLGSYDVWLDVQDTDFYFTMYGYNSAMGSGDLRMRYHIVYDLYSNEKTPLEYGYDNFYVKLYALTLDFNTYVAINDEGLEYYSNLNDIYYEANWNYPRSINYYNYLNYDGERMENTLWSYEELQFYTTLKFDFGNGSSSTLFECYNPSPNYTEFFRHRLTNPCYAYDEKFYYYRSYYTAGYQFERDITTSTSLVNDWYEILNTNIASAEKIAVSYNDGYTNGYTNGYNEGYSIGSNQDETITTVFNGIFGVALLPLNMFLTMLNFEVLGINISGIITALLTVAMVVIMIKFITGKSVSGGGE